MVHGGGEHSRRDLSDHRRNGSLAATNYKFKLEKGTLTITSAGTMAKPVCTANGNVFTSPPMVTSTDATPGAVIITRRTEPRRRRVRRCKTGPIAAAKTGVIEAIGVANGYLNSEVRIQDGRLERAELR